MYNKVVEARLTHKEGEMTRIRTALIFSAAFVLSSVSAQAITVTQTGDATTIVGAILSPGTTLVGTPTFIGNPLGAGTFTAGLSSGIGIDQGIILSSGEASLAPGPNEDDGKSGFLSSPGDTDLSTLAGFQTYDATGIEFDFSVAPGPAVDLVFNFVFASEEYLEWVDTDFNDVFGFFVDGVNIGFVPGTTQPVTINTINNVTNSSYYVDNPDLYTGGAPSPYALEYDGFTKVLTARLTGLTPGTHHMKLVVADTSDPDWDAAVFIQAGSFAVNPSLPAWRNGEADAGNSWKWTNWFGYYNTTYYPWVYHAQHGWLYPFEDGSGGVFFWYHDMQKFVWTTPTTYPFLYRWGGGDTWLWYLKDSSNPRLFNNYGTGLWEALP